MLSSVLTEKRVVVNVGSVTETHKQGHGVDECRPGAHLFEFPGVSDDGLGDHHRPSYAAQLQAKSDVLHVLKRESTEIGEEHPSYEQSLVTVDHPRYSESLVVEPGEGAKHRPGTAETVAKAAGSNRFRQARDTLQTVIGQQGVCVEKEKPLTNGILSTGVQLHGTPLFDLEQLEAQIVCRPFLHDRGCSVGAAAVDHDHLELAVLGESDIESGGQGPLLVKRWDDDADQRR